MGILRSSNEVSCNNGIRTKHAKTILISVSDLNRISTNLNFKMLNPPKNQPVQSKTQSSNAVEEFCFQRTQPHSIILISGKVLLPLCWGKRKIPAIIRSTPAHRKLSTGAISLWFACVCVGLANASRIR